MKPEPKITIEPSSYRGWEMEFNEHADGFNVPFFKARKGRQTVQASSPKGLMHEIDNAEKLTAKFKTPIKAMRQGYGEWERINVHTVCGDRIYYVDAKGEQGSEFITNINNDHRPIYLDTAENVERINEVVKLQKRASDLSRKADEIKKTWIKLTEADIMLAAREDSK